MQDIFGLHIKRVFIKNSQVMPGLPGFKPKGDGKTTCYFCGKMLTDELSFARGVGPECAKTRGSMPTKEWIEEYAKAFKKYQFTQKRKNLPIASFHKWLSEQDIEKTMRY